MRYLILLLFLCGCQAPEATKQLSDRVPDREVIRTEVIEKLYFDFRYKDIHSIYEEKANVAL